MCLFVGNKQWGNQGAGNNWDIYYPIVYTKYAYITVTIDNGATSTSHQYTALANGGNKLNKFTLITSNNSEIGIAWLSIGS